MPNPTNQPEYMPAIKRYSKSDICKLLVDPTCDLNTYTGPQLNTKKLRKEILNTKIAGEPMLKMLGINSVKEYDRMYYFSPSQSELILRELL